MGASKTLEGGNCLVPIAAQSGCFSQAKPGERGLRVLRQLLPKLSPSGFGKALVEQDRSQFRVDLRLVRRLSQQTEENRGGTQVVSIRQEILSRELLPDDARRKLLREDSRDLRRQAAVRQAEFVPGVWDGRRAPRLLLVFPRGLFQTTASLESVT